MKNQLKMCKDQPRLFGTNGVRGIFGKEITVDFIVDLSYAIATYFQKGPIVVGYDGRESGPILSKVVRASLNSAGLDVENAKLIPTPCLQYATKYLGYNGGIMVTASHNPPEYNGIKTIASDGVEVSRMDELKIEAAYYSGKFSKMDGCGRDSINESVIDSYIRAVLRFVDVERIRSRKFKVVIDVGNGAQSTVIPLIVEKLGCKAIIINGSIDGNFPGRGPEPTADNLHVLTNMVTDTNADIGVAYDGDGDRSIFCDEKGTIQWGDKTGTLLVRYLLKNKHKGAEIICPINTTMALSMIVEQEGSKLFYTKVGSVEVSREMVKRKSYIGLEENGGFMYGKLNEVRDGVMTTALVLDMMASSKEEARLSEFISSLPRIYQYKSKFKCASKQVAANVVNECLQHGNPKKIETLDGAKIWIDEETWVMVRPSGTEPLIRMYAESTDKPLLDSKVREYTRLIKNKTEERM